MKLTYILFISLIKILKNEYILDLMKFIEYNLYQIMNIYHLKLKISYFRIIKNNLDSFILYLIFIILPLEIIIKL